MTPGTIPSLSEKDHPMKAEILQILQMQQAGKLTQDQAADLLAMLADQAREKSSVSAPQEEGAPGPQRERGTSFPSNAAATLQSIVDSAVGLGASIGRSASVLATEIAQTVHREQAGNAITLSKVEAPAGDRYSFRSNSFNVSKITGVTLNDSEFSNNSVNASRLTAMTLTHGKFSQNDIAGSSLTTLTLEGAPAQSSTPPQLEPDSMALAQVATPGAMATLRGATFNASKVARVRILSGSTLDACTFLTTVVKDLELAEGASFRDSKVIDSMIHASRAVRSTLANMAIERSQVQALTVKDSTLDRLALHATRMDEVTISNSKLTNTRFRRYALGSGVGSRESVVTESTIDGCTLTDCDFLGCTFRRTTLRNLSLSGLTIRNVDFTGLTLDSEDAFKKAAGLV
jgi:uncharacterized protein YjbI with pentapeptide repeats